MENIRKCSLSTTKNTNNKLYLSSNSIITQKSLTIEGNKISKNKMYSTRNHSIIYPDKRKMKIKNKNSNFFKKKKLKEEKFYNFTDNNDNLIYSNKMNATILN